MKQADRAARSTEVRRRQAMHAGIGASDQEVSAAGRQDQMTRKAHAATCEAKAYFKRTSYNISCAVNSCLLFFWSCV